jgi:hypothetical protein
MKLRKTQAADPSAAHAEALAAVAALAALKDELAAKRAEREVRAEQLRDIRERLADAENRVRGLWRDGDETAHKRASAAVAAAAEQAKHAKAAISALEVEIVDRETRKNVFAVSVTPDVVAYHQSLIAAAESKLEGLQRLRADIIARLDAAPPSDPAAAMLREREDILADIAQGEPRAADLERLDARIRDAQEKAAPAVAKYQADKDADRQALAGIDRRTVEVAADLRSLRAAAPILLGSFLGRELRDMAAQYEAVAEEAAGLLLTMRVLDDLIRKNALPVPHGINLGALERTFLPRPMSEHEVSTWRSIVGFAGENLKAATEAAVSRLAESGVTIAAR